MTAFQETFKRKEMKYVLSTAQMQTIVEQLTNYMTIDEYGKSRVSSIYFDTPERNLIARSIEKPLYKEKLRLRWYGKTASGPIFTEMKKKFDGIVYKRRVGTSAQAAALWANGASYVEACKQFPLASAIAQEEALCARSIQISREIDAMRARNGNLLPSALIACERTSYIVHNQSDESYESYKSRTTTHRDEMTPTAAPLNAQTPEDLRITFDENLHARDLLSRANSIKSTAMALLPSNQVIMEVKSTHPMPLWLVHTLAKCDARPSSFSKYGELYKKGKLSCSTSR